MTAPKVCDRCGAALDAGETCDCENEEIEYEQNEEKRLAS